MDTDNAISLLRELVKIPSFIGKSNPSYEFGVSNFLIEYFKKNLPNFELKTIPFEGKKRVNLLFRNSKEVKILFACHMDTVAPSDSKAFDMKVDKGKAFGLGTKDMKGGIVSTILALKEVGDIGGIGVLFYGDEETTFKGINKITKEAKRYFKTSPDLIISPESRFNFGIGARGICVIKLKVFGKRAHSARRELGVDAVRSLYYSVEQVEKKLNKVKSDLGETTLTIASINGGLLEPSGKIGFHAGTIPDYVEAVVSVRNAHPQITGENITRLISQNLKRNGAKAKFEIVEDYPARTTPKPLVVKLLNTAKKAGFKVEVGDSKLSGFNDVTILGRKISSPIVNFGPYGEGNHTKDEWVNIKSLTDTALVFCYLVKEFCKQ